MYTAIVIIIATTTATIHSMTTATDTPITTDDLSSCFHPVALVLDGDVNRNPVLTVCVNSRVSVAVRLCDKVGMYIG